MWIGSSRDSTATPLGLTWCGSVKALAIVFTWNTTVQQQTNFYDKLKDIQTQMRLWSCWGLSLFGKITIIKSFLSPKMLYIFSVLPSPEVFIKQLNTIIYNFLRKGPDKVAWPAVINDLKYGGLNLMDLETTIKSLRLQYRSKVSYQPSSRFSRDEISRDETLETRFLPRENHWSVCFGINHKQLACEKTIYFSRLDEVCTTRESGLSGSCSTRHFKRNDLWITSEKACGKDEKSTLKTFTKIPVRRALNFFIAAYWLCMNMYDSFWMEICSARSNTIIIAYEETEWK